MGSVAVYTSTYPETLMVDRHTAALEAENAHLRALLAQTQRRAAADADRFAAENARALAEAASLACLYERGLAEGAARLASVEDLNTQLRASEELNRRILWTTTDCVKILDLDGRLIALSENGPSVLGAEDCTALVGQSWIAFWSCEASRARIGEALEAARAGRASRFQAMLEIGSSTRTVTWWDIAVTPVNGDDGQPERILAVSRDISELKQNEARQTLLMQELAHRVKNTLAMVQAVATQTLRNAVSLEAAGEALGARLIALAQAHDVLMQGSWSSTDLRKLVAGAVKLHGDGAPDRFRVQGPDIILGERPGLTLGLMLHELGTNAAKYGALSTPNAHVEIAWNIARSGSTEHLHFRWEEVGGPLVAAPTRTGFGTRLIERSLSHRFDGIVSLSYPSTGVVLTLEAPLAGVLGEAA